MYWTAETRHIRDWIIALSIALFLVAVWLVGAFHFEQLDKDARRERDLPTHVSSSVR